MRSGVGDRLLHCAGDERFTPPFLLLLIND